LTVEATREYSDYCAPPGSHGATISILGLLDVVKLRLAWRVALANYKMQVIIFLRAACCDPKVLL
jgi:hypothetical protein